ncbi:hypothetical protein NQ317_003709 [Molorchus minor]|uniref:F-box domain-containing protein n=1 Tax=Molorchus minor TaxID=1323400 RepID=A0ABQ9K389_9CUCU|nr:hypothetical protein NQ317_003709 [Molorchus minor]
MAESSGSVVSNNVNTQKQSCAVKTTDGSEGNKTEKVMEPLLLEDFKYNDEPKSLSNLLEFFEKNKISPIYECSLACIPAADDILVNCVVKGVENGHYNTIIDPLTYFSSSSTCIRLNKLQNLNHLSRVVKDSVCYPAKQVILRNNGEIVDCLEQLPPEIVLFIMCYLNIKDLVRFGQTNSFFYKLMQTPKLWMRRIKIDLGEHV